MLRKRVLIMLGGCFLASGAAWADGVAYVDCASHPETTLVFGKPRRTPETVASVACGERFTILQYGFIFSRVQTKDGQVGYVYSNLISADRSGAAVPQSTPARMPTAPSTAPSATTTVAPPNPTPAPQSQATSIQQAPVEAPAAAAIAPKPAAATVQPSAAAPTQTQVTVVQPVSTQTTAGQPVSAPAPAVSSHVPETPVTIAPPASTAPEQPKAAPTPLASTETAAPAASVAESPAKAAPEANPTEANPTEGTPAAQPESAPAEPAAPIRAVRARESWERPNAGGRRLVPLIELFGGYGFARFDNGAGASASNLNGVIGSFGWNVKPWLQIVADSSYNFVTVSSVKSVMYGNHWGPRIFYRGRNRWGLTPFVEGLVGGTRADITVPGVGGYTTSQNVLSYKVGGGLDMKLSRKIEIRLLDVDYYRTSFGTNLYQNNYWASAGIVLWLFGASE